MFECLRCGYITDRKYNLITHLNRKRVCRVNNLDVERAVLLDELYKYTNRNVKLINNVSITSIIHQQKINKESIKKERLSNENLKTEKPYGCSYCGKAFRHRQGRFTHEKKHCKERKKLQSQDTTNINIIEQQQQELIQMQQTILELQQEVKRLSQQNSSSVTNNSHNNNINKHNTNSFNTVNVNLNTLGNENIKYLKSFLLKNIQNIIQCKTDFFIDYVKQKHFHPEHIENHNVVSFNQRSNSMYGYMKQDTHLERRLKNNISLVLYKNIIDDVSIFVETQLEKKKTKPKKVAILNRAAERMIKQEDAIHDYEHKDDDTDSDENEKKNNIKVVDTHLKEIENTIYNESKSTYGDISSYYVKHNEQNDDISVI